MHRTRHLRDSARKLRVGTHFLGKWLGSAVGEALGRPELSRPQMVCTLLTSRCNFKCSFCNHPRLTHVDEMPLSKWKEVLLALRDWLGTFRINFLGGEPLLYPDLYELLAVCKEHGIMAGITTNGFLLGGEVIRELSRLDLFNLSISVDGMDPTVHDRMRGVPGSHDRIMAAVPLLREHMRGTRVAFRTNVLQDNLDDLVPLADFVRESGLGAIGYQPVEYRNLDEAEDRAYRSGSGVVPDERVDAYAREELPENMATHWVADLEKLDAVIRRLQVRLSAGWPILNSARHLEHVRRYYHGPDLVYRVPQRCRTGWEHMVILPDGKVRSCTELPPYGNLYERAPRDIWCSEEARRHRELCARCSRTCMNLFFWKRTLPEKAELFLRFF